MKRRKIVYLAIAACIGTATYFGWKNTARGAYESAEYTVVETDGSFEIREYPELMLVTTSSQFKAHGDDRSFMRLFRYISGANDAERKVAMTTPVFMQPDAGKSPGQMGFVLPKKIAEDGAPNPTGDNVRLQQRAGGRFAAFRFSGRMTSDAAEKAETSLRKWISERGLKAEGEAEFAGYDPPWTPGPLRRNEALIRLQAADKETASGEQTSPGEDLSGRQPDVED